MLFAELTHSQVAAMQRLFNYVLIKMSKHVEIDINYLEVGMLRRFHALGEPHQLEAKELEYILGTGYESLACVETYELHNEQCDDRELEITLLEDVSDYMPLEGYLDQIIDITEDDQRAEVDEEDEFQLLEPEAQIDFRDFFSLPEQEDYMLWQTTTAAA